jgi:cytochrome c heme-lyase
MDNAHPGRDGPMDPKDSTTMNDKVGCPMDHTNVDTTMNPKDTTSTAVDLDSNRTYSSIPKSDGLWEYPSHDQFHSALLRKGKPAPANQIANMVDIHNFLNEGSFCNPGCWDQIKQWEAKYHPSCSNLRLIRFQGRPQDLSPKAWFYTMFRGADRPFDRHDWFVDRCGTSVRYVIDYYSGIPDEHGNPAFNVDVRPALDSPTSFIDRFRHAVSDLCDRF